MSKIIELRAKRNTLWEQTKNFLEEHRGENGLVAAEFVDQYDRMADEVAKLGAEIERLERQAEVDAKLAQPTSRYLDINLQAFLAGYEIGTQKSK